MRWESGRFTDSDEEGDPVVWGKGPGRSGGVERRIFHRGLRKELHNVPFDSFGSLNEGCRGTSVKI